MLTCYSFNRLFNFSLYINKYISLFTYSLRNLLRLYRKSLCSTIHHMIICPCSQVKRRKRTQIYNIERWNFTRVKFRALVRVVTLWCFPYVAAMTTTAALLVTWLNVLNTWNIITARHGSDLEFGMISQQWKHTFKIYRMGKPYDGFKLTCSEELNLMFIIALSIQRLCF